MLVSTSINIFFWMNGFNQAVDVICFRWRHRCDERERNDLRYCDKSWLVELHHPCRGQITCVMTLHIVPHPPTLYPWLYHTLFPQECTTGNKANHTFKMQCINSIHKGHLFPHPTSPPLKLPWFNRQSYFTITPWGDRMLYPNPKGEHSVKFRHSFCGEWYMDCH